MKAPFLLVAHSLKRVRWLVAVVALLLALFQIFLIVMAAAFHRSGSMTGLADMLPPFVREFFGPSLTAFLSFAGMISQVYFHPIVLVSLIVLAIVVATIPTGEIESGFMDFILSRPIARHWMITRSIAVSVISIGAVLAAMLTATCGGLYAFGPRGTPWPPPARIVVLAGNLGLLILAWSSIAMAIGAASRRRGMAAGLAGFLALLTFLLDYVARVWEPAKAAAWLSPFHYYNALELIAGTPLDPCHLVVLAGIATTGFILAYGFFLRRDLSK